jgi:hypothetical protein
MLLIDKPSTVAKKKLRKVIEGVCKSMDWWENLNRKPLISHEDHGA